MHVGAGLDRRSGGGRWVCHLGSLKTKRATHPGSKRGMNMPPRLAAAGMRGPKCYLGGSFSSANYLPGGFSTAAQRGGYWHYLGPRSSLRSRRRHVGSRIRDGAAGMASSSSGHHIAALGTHRRISFRRRRVISTICASVMELRRSEFASRRESTMTICTGPPPSPPEGPEAIPRAGAGPTYPPPA